MAAFGKAASRLNDDQLHRYWTRGEGRGRWNTWTELYQHLARHVGPERAKRMASAWFQEVKGYASGSDRNRVAQGKLPRGKRVGPG